MQDGEPYVAKFPDKLGNLCSRDIPRPKILNRFFRHFNAVDLTNQMRQHHLGLELAWRTTNPMFRVMTTLVGMTVADCHAGVRFDKDHPEYKVRCKWTIHTFAKELAKQLLWPDKYDRECKDSRKKEKSHAKQSTQGTKSLDLRRHRLVRMPRDQVRDGKKFRNNPRACSVCRTPRCTMIFCENCQVPLCNPIRNDGQDVTDCYATHVAHDGWMDNRKRKSKQGFGGGGATK